MTHKIGIIGCGGIARGKHLPSIKAMGDRAEITATCDVLIDRAEWAANQFGAPGCKAYTCYKELLAGHPEIGIIHVLTPNVSHCEITVAAFEAGKHVMCEKPMAATYADAKVMMEAYKKSGKLFTIGYQNRYRPDSLTLKKLCRDGELGQIYYAQAHAIRRRGVPTWGVFTDKAAQGGGPLIDIGTHALDLTLWFMDNYEPQAVTGSTFNKLGTTLTADQQGNRMGVWDPTTYEVEDAAFGFITMKDGSLITLDSSWILNTTEERAAASYLCGTMAGAELTGVGMEGGGKLFVNKVVGGKLAKIDVDVAQRRFPPPPAGAPQMPGCVEECTAWLDAVEGKAELSTKPEQALVVTQILDAIYESAAIGKQIIFK